MNTETAPEPQAGNFPIPPATMEFLVLSLKAQAEMQLGLLHFGDETDRPQPDLRIARHTIDILALLQDKTRNNLTMEEHRLLENSLTEIRFRYVQALEAPSRPARAPQPAQEAPVQEALGKEGSAQA